jgi:hypothetical protein
MSQTLAAAKPARAILRYTEAAATWTQILLPEWARRVQISPVTNAASVIVASVPGVTDGAAFTGSENFESVAGNSKYSIPVTPGRSPTPQSTVFLRVAASTVIEISVEEGEAG